MNTYKELSFRELLICSIEFWYFFFNIIVQIIGYILEAGKWFGWLLFFGFFVAYAFKIWYVCYKLR